MNDELYKNIADAIASNTFDNIQDDIIKLTDIAKSLEENIKAKDDIIQNKDAEIQRLTDENIKARLRVSELYMQKAQDITNTSKENEKNAGVDLQKIIESED